MSFPNCNFFPCIWTFTTIQKYASVFPTENCCFYPFIYCMQLIGFGAKIVTNKLNLSIHLFFWLFFMLWVSFPISTFARIEKEDFCISNRKLLLHPFTSFMQSRIWGKAGHHVSGEEGKNYHQNHIFRAISIVGTTIWTHLVVGLVIIIAGLFRKLPLHTSC